jgi:hypothetical protein
MTDDKPTPGARGFDEDLILRLPMPSAHRPCGCRTYSGGAEARLHRHAQHFNAAGDDRAASEDGR